MQLARLAEEDQARAGFYTLLARLLARPMDSAQLAELAGMVVAAEEGEAMVALSTLKLAATQARPEAVEDEYHRLFIGVGRGELLPYGSWYQTGALMERPLAELRADLARLGLARDPDNPDPEDHAAFLCEVMALLINSPEFSAETEQAFYRNHLDSWLGSFFQDVEQSENACFYKAVGHLGRIFMALERAYQGVDGR